jgi:predicted transcriptional regulator
MPVVNENNELIGVIKYTDIADTIFDPSLNDLVVAAEIASDKFPRLSPEDTLKTAMLALKDHPKEAYLLVVAANDPCKLVGIVSHNDLLAAHMHRSSSP